MSMIACSFGSKDVTSPVFLSIALISSSFSYNFSKTRERVDSWFVDVINAFLW